MLTQILVFAKKEVILSAGSFNTPKLLLLSGIGPAEELRAHGIDATQDLPGVGKDLHDHVLISLGAKFTPEVGLTARDKFEANEESVKAAIGAWSKDGTGVTSLHNSNMLGAWLKDPKIYKTEEFNNLGKTTKEYLLRETVPTYELILAGPKMPPMYVIPEDSSYLTVTLCGMNLQSKGSITLKSASPDDDAVIDPNYFSHPFDQRVMINATREGMKFLSTAPSLAPHFRGYVLGPESDSEEDILVRNHFLYSAALELGCCRYQTLLPNSAPC